MWKLVRGVSISETVVSSLHAWTLLQQTIQHPVREKSHMASALDRSGCEDTGRWGLCNFTVCCKGKHMVLLPLLRKSPWPVRACQWEWSVGRTVFLGDAELSVKHSLFCPASITFSTQFLLTVQFSQLVSPSPYEKILLYALNGFQILFFTFIYLWTSCVCHDMCGAQRTAFVGGLSFYLGIVLIRFGSRVLLPAEALN